MDIEFIYDPLQVRLFDNRGTVPGRAFGKVGLALMNDMWATVKSQGIDTTGRT